MYPSSPLQQLLESMAGERGRSRLNAAAQEQQGEDDGGAW